MALTDHEYFAASFTMVFTPRNVTRRLSPFSNLALENVDSLCFFRHNQYFPAVDMEIVDRHAHGHQQFHGRWFERIPEERDVQRLRGPEMAIRKRLVTGDGRHFRFGSDERPDFVAERPMQVLLDLPVRGPPLFPAAP